MKDYNYIASKMLPEKIDIQATTTIRAEGYNQAIDDCIPILAEQLEGKIKILEEEREKWWSKADKPDDCYVTMDAVREKDKRIDKLEKELTTLKQRCSVDNLILTIREYNCFGSVCATKIAMGINKMIMGD